MAQSDADDATRETDDGPFPLYAVLDMDTGGFVRQGFSGSHLWAAPSEAQEAATKDSHTVVRVDEVEEGEDEDQ